MPLGNKGTHFVLGLSSFSSDSAMITENTQQTISLSLGTVFSDVTGRSEHQRDAVPREAGQVPGALATV